MQRSFLVLATVALGCFSCSGNDNQDVHDVQHGATQEHDQATNDVQHKDIGNEFATFEEIHNLMQKTDLYSPSRQSRRDNTYPEDESSAYRKLKECLLEGRYNTIYKGDNKSSCDRYEVVDNALKSTDEFSQNGRFRFRSQEDIDEVICKLSEARNELQNGGNPLK